MAGRLRELNCDFPIHITGRTNNRDEFPLRLETAWEICSDYLSLINSEFGIRIHSFLLMPNHYHLIAQDPLLKMPDAMEYFGREASREFGRLSGRINRFWGTRYHSSVIKSPLYYLHAYKYLYRNPVKAGLSESVLDYRYSTLGQLLGLHRGIIPLEEDHTLFNNVSGTLLWLDEPYNELEDESLRRALRKKTFKLRLNPNSKTPLLLEKWESIPAWLR